MSKKRSKGKPVATTSPDMAVEQVERLRELFSEVVSEGRVDFEKLIG